VIVDEQENDEIQRVKYIASFFAYGNIDQLITQNQKAGNFLNGTYFYAKNMLLIKDCSKATIVKVIDDLIEDGSFREVFLKS